MMIQQNPCQTDCQDIERHPMESVQRFQKMKQMQSVSRISVKWKKLIQTCIEAEIVSVHPNFVVKARETAR